MNKIEWKLISTAPNETVVLLFGNSGMMKPHNKYIISGYKNQEYHNGKFNDIQGDCLTDQFYKPTHWAELPNLPRENK